MVLKPLLTNFQTQGQSIYYVFIFKSFLIPSHFVIKCHLWRPLPYFADFCDFGNFDDFQCEMFLKYNERTSYYLMSAHIFEYSKRVVRFGSNLKKNMFPTRSRLWPKNLLLIKKSGISTQS